MTNRENRSARSGALRGAHGLGLACAVVLATCGGCSLPGMDLFAGFPFEFEPAENPGELSPELSFVIANKQQFDTQGVQVFAGVVPGTLVDPLEGLTGCWGFYERQQPFGEAVSPVEVFEAYHFDAATGEVERWVLTTSFLIVPEIYAWDQGTYTVADDGRLLVTIESYLIADRTAGQARISTNLPPAFRDVTKFVTLSGDNALIAGTSDTDETVPSDGFVFRRFDCP
jgi:hypothetical protein